MNWHALFVTALGTVLPAAFMQMFPFWQRTFFFTVRVPEGFGETGAGYTPSLGHPPVRVVVPVRFLSFLELVSAMR